MKLNATTFPLFYYKKHQKIEAENTQKTNSKRRNRKMFLPPDETKTRQLF